MTFAPGIERLVSLKVADVMNAKTTTISASQSMEDVAKTFLNLNISAAPVVDETGRFVGILSATDFLRRDSGEEPHRLRSRDSGWDIARILDTASSYMTKSVTTVAPGAALIAAASIMADNHLHRIPVVDEDNRVVGIISTMDITAVVVQVVDETEVQLSTKSRR